MPTRQILVTLVTTDGATRVREGPAPLHLFPEQPPEEKRIYARVSADDLKKAMRVLRAVAGAKAVWELLHALWQVLADE